jgi:hypothetical protein
MIRKIQPSGFDTAVNVESNMFPANGVMMDAAALTWLPFVDVSRPHKVMLSLVSLYHPRCA